MVKMTKRFISSDRLISRGIVPKEERRRRRKSGKQPYNKVRLSLVPVQVVEMRPDQISVLEMSQIRAVWEKAFPGRDWVTYMGQYLRRDPPEPEQEQETETRKAPSIFVEKRGREIVSIALVQVIPDIPGAPEGANVRSIYRPWTDSVGSQETNEEDWSPPPSPPPSSVPVESKGSLEIYHETPNKGLYISNVCTSSFFPFHSPILLRLIESIVLKYGNRYDLAVHNVENMEYSSNMCSVYGQFCFRILDQMPWNEDGQQRRLLLRPIGGRWSQFLYSQSKPCVVPLHQLRLNIPPRAVIASSVGAIAGGLPDSVEGETVMDVTRKNPDGSIEGYLPTKEGHYVCVVIPHDLAKEYTEGVSSPKRRLKYETRRRSREMSKRKSRKMSRRRSRKMSRRRSRKMSRRRSRKMSKRKSRKMSRRRSRQKTRRYRNSVGVRSKKSRREKRHT